MSALAKAYARCRRLEAERERKHRKYTTRAESDARAVHYQKPQTHGEDDEELDFGFDLTDKGAGSEDVRSFDEKIEGSYYTRRIKVVRKRLSRNCPELVEVFNLIVKNENNRGESIAELSAKGLAPKVARIRYWRHLKKLSFFFKAQ